MNHGTLAALIRELPAKERLARARWAFDGALAIPNDTRRINAVTALAPALPPDLAVRVLQFVESVSRRVEFPKRRAALDVLAPQLPTSALPVALDTFRNMPDLRSADIPRMSRFFKRLVQDDPTESIRELFGRTPDTSDPRDSWLWTLAPFLTTRLAEDALVAAKALDTKYGRRWSLAALAPRLPDQLRPAHSTPATTLLQRILQGSISLIGCKPVETWDTAQHASSSISATLCGAASSWRAS